MDSYRCFVEATGEFSSHPRVSLDAFFIICIRALGNGSLVCLGSGWRKRCVRASIR